MGLTWRDAAETHAAALLDSIKIAAKAPQLVPMEMVVVDRPSHVDRMVATKMREWGLDPDGAPVGLPVKAQAAAATPTHDFVSALYRPYVSPI